MMVMMTMLCPTQTTLWSQFVLQFYSAPRNPLVVFKGVYFQWRNDGVAAASSDGGPTGGRGPPTVLEFLLINFGVCLVLLKLKNAKRHNQELAKS